jgi:hypothetical protein
MPAVRGEAAHVEIADNVYSMCDVNDLEMDVGGGMQAGGCRCGRHKRGRGEVRGRHLSVMRSDP